MNICKQATLCVLLGCVGGFVNASAGAEFLPEAKPITYPSQMPSTRMPAIKGCSSSQAAFLKKIWPLAHLYVWRSERLIHEIRSQPKNQRAGFWSQDHIDSVNSISPRSWFGSYDSDGVRTVAQALRKARQRFEGSGIGHIRKLRCGRPIARNRDRDVDACPSGNQAAKAPPVPITRR